MPNMKPPNSNNAVGPPTVSTRLKAYPSRPNPDSPMKTSNAIRIILMPPIISIGPKTILSFNGNSTRRILSVASIPASRNALISLARTGPYITLKPLSFLTRWALIPGPPNCGTIKFLCDTIPLIPVASMRFTSSSVPNVPLPAAHQTLRPRVSRTRSHASRRASSSSLRQA